MFGIKSLLVLLTQRLRRNLVWILNEVKERVRRVLSYSFLFSAHLPMLAMLCNSLAIVGLSRFIWSFLGCIPSPKSSAPFVEVCNLFKRAFY